MGRLSIYDVRFRARSSEDLADDAVERLRVQLAGMPGIASAIGADHDPVTGTVGGAFEVQVARGMAAAARDSSRLAKEALKLAGLGEARLVELHIALRRTP
jgi:hypothetical protein